MNASNRRSLKYMALAVLLLTLACITYWFHQNFIHRSAWSGSPESYQELMDNWAAQRNIPGVILRIDKAQEEIFHGASGTLALSGDESIMPDTPFHTASVGKMFTTLTLLKLHEKGVLSLDEPVAPYVNREIITELLVVDGKDYSQEITFRQLATHRSGLPNTDESLRFLFWALSKRDRKRLPSELIEFARKMTPAGKPDETTSYSSAGFFLLGLALEGVTGQPYHSIVRQQLLNPMGMMDTYESNRELPVEHRTSHHYIGFIDLAQDTDPSFEFADGGFVTTARDLQKLGEAIIQSRLFDNDAVGQIFDTPLPDGSGFGYFWMQLPDGVEYLFQPGYWGVRFMVFPKQEMVVTYTLNQSNTDARQFTRQLIELLREDGLL